MSRTIALLVALCISGAAQITLSGKNLHDETDSLENYRGRPLVVNFWATWCAPCKEEMRLLSAAYTKYESQNVAIIAASLDDSRHRRLVERFVKKQKMSMPVWMGLSADEMQKVTGSPALPATLFIDRDGTLISRIVGQLRAHEVRERIDWMLSDRAGSPPAAEVNHLK